MDGYLFRAGFNIPERMFIRDVLTDMHSSAEASANALAIETWIELMMAADYQDERTLHGKIAAARMRREAREGIRTVMEAVRKQKRSLYVRGEGIARMPLGFGVVCLRYGYS
ncbi:MAG: hypothetical protein DI585_05695 [Pseudomonas fluorescens]|nr:MAG: hypothetical protein DI585_05695 [Pseudomonas fluorescens]